MTNQEAISVLESINAKTDYFLINDDARAEAIDMAISALQVQDLQPICNELAKDTNVPNKDCISRKAAIDTEGLEEEIRCEMCKNPMHTDRGCDGHCKYDEKLYEKIIQILDKRIKQLPSAHPEPRWIPVSERMPKDGENCLLSVRYSNNFLVDRGTYSTDLFKVDKEDFFGNRGESGWYYLSSEYGYCKILNVIAWMPEPRPYGEVPMRLVRQAFEKLPEPCEDAVSRADMLETYADLYDVFEDNDQIRKELNKVYDKLNALPPVAPKRKTGKWIPIQRGLFNKEVTQVKCDQCGNLLDLIGVNCGRGDANFCPNCGADMRGEQDATD